MKTIQSKLENYADVLFEHRNKAYGAYVIRKEYSNNLIKSILTVSVLLFLPFLFLLTHHAVTKEKTVYDQVTKFEAVDYIFEETKQQFDEIAGVLQAANTPDNTFDPRTAPLSNNFLEDNPYPNEVPHQTVPETGATGNLPAGETTGTGTAATGTEPINTLPFAGAEPSSEAVVDVPEVMPEFIGGENKMAQFLNDQINYPAIEREEGFEGKVYVQFIVNADGTIGEVEVVKSSGRKSIDREAVRVVKMMPNWIPGRYGDKPVKVRLNLPLDFVAADK